MDPGPPVLPGSTPPGGGGGHPTPEAGGRGDGVGDATGGRRSSGRGSAAAIGAVALVALLSVAGFVVATKDQPAEHADPTTSLVPSIADGGFFPTWEIDLAGQGVRPADLPDGSSRLAIARGTVAVITNDGRVLGFEAKDGAAIWESIPQRDGAVTTHDLSGRGIPAPPQKSTAGPARLTGVTVSGADAVVVSNGWRTYLLDPLHGARYWATDPGLVRVEPLSRSVFLESGTELRRVDPGTGRPMWRYDAGASGVLVGATVVMAKGIELAGIDDASGTKAWHEPSPVGPVRQLTPAAERSAPRPEVDAVAVVGDDGSLAVVQASTGVVRWKRDANGGAGVRSIVAANSVQVIVREAGGDLVSVDQADGHEHWRRRADLPAGSVGWLSNSVLVVAGDGGAAVLTANGGQVIARFEEPLVGPAVTDGHVICVLRSRGDTPPNATLTCVPVPL